MTMMTVTEPSVWIGCLACYNDGRLVGEWFPAESAGDVTTQQVHDVGNGPTVNAGGYVGMGWDESPHEELWIFDHEGMPIRGECSPMEAQKWGELIDSVDEWQRSAFLAWVANGDYCHGGDGMPDVSDFEDSYAGEWDSFREYAENLADDIGLLSEVPDELAAYFDWDAWTRDLAFDYSTATAPNGGVYVFRSC